MADNVIAEAVVTPGSTFAADLIAGALYVRNKLTLGADGVNAGDVCDANPMPIWDAGQSITVDGSVSVLGTVNVSGSIVGISGTVGIAGVVSVSGPVTVTGTFWQATQPVSLAALPPLAAGTAVIGHVIVDSGSLAVTGTFWQATQPVSIAVMPPLVAGTAVIGHVIVDSGSIGIAGTVTVAAHDVTNAGVFAVQSGGNVAHGVADAGNPVKQGFKATTSLSAQTPTANGQRTDGFADVDGVQIVRTHCPLEDIVQDRATDTTGNSTAFAGGLAAPGAGLRLYVKKLTIANSSATFCTVDIRDGAAGAIIWTLPVPANGGITEYYDPPLKFSVNQAVAFDASAAIATLTVSGNGFKSKI
jgi:hypothetical protein